jgi:hypothetical protein
MKTLLCKLRVALLTGWMIHGSNPSSRDKIFFSVPKCSDYLSSHSASHSVGNGVLSQWEK